MARLCCPCLNITVNVTGDWTANTIPISTLLSRARPRHIMAEHELLYEVQLDVAGIIVRQTLLALSCQVEDWIVTSCGNCESDVCVTHAVKADRTFVTPQLLSSHESIQKVMEKDFFSAIFKILLPPREAEMQKRSRVSSMTFGHEDSDMKLVHRQMKEYLKEQDSAMEARIRLYEKEQRREFQLLQERAHQQRTTFFSTLSKVLEKSSSEVQRSSIVEEDGGNSHHGANMKTTPTFPQGMSSTGTASTGPLSDLSHKAKLDGVQKGPSDVPHSITITLHSDTPVTQVSDRDEQEDDSIFTLDDLDGEAATEYSGPLAAGGSVGPLAGEGSVDVAFPQSDDEEISTDDSSFRDLSALHTMTYGTSVPVNIPMYHKHSVPADSSSPGEDGGGVGEDGDRGGGFEMREVGNCIRQLALSVQDTGMFGDLPRPRIMNNPPTH